MFYLPIRKLKPRQYFDIDWWVCEIHLSPVSCSIKLHCLEYCFIHTPDLFISSLQVSNRALSHCVLLSNLYISFWQLSGIDRCYLVAVSEHILLCILSLVPLYSTRFFPLCVLAVNASSCALSLAMQIFVGIKVLKIFKNTLIVDIICTVNFVLFSVWNNFYFWINFLPCSVWCVVLIWGRSYINKEQRSLVCIFDMALPWIITAHLENGCTNFLSQQKPRLHSICCFFFFTCTYTYEAVAMYGVS